MSRSLLPAFLCALILHSLLALVELNAFKRPFSVKVPPKPMTIDIVKSRPVKKSPLINSPAIVVKEPIRKKEIKKEVKPQKRVKPKIKEKKRIQPRPPQPSISGQAEKSIAHQSPVNLPPIKKEDVFFEEDDLFVPDMVDIPIGIPKKKDIPDSTSTAPVTYALPIYKRNIPPQYPLLARRRAYQGTVLLEVLVKKDGKAGSIRLARSSGYEILDKAAITGVKDWLFQPAKRGDELVEMWVEIPIRFQLK